MKKLTVSEMRKIEGGGFFKWISDLLWKHAENQTKWIAEEFSG